MLKNYLESTIRNLRNKKGYTAIMILGSTLGRACFMVIVSWVSDELSHDTFHAKSNRIYRIAASVETPYDQFQQALTSMPFAPALIREIPAIQEAVRLDNNDVVVISERVRFKEDKILMTDPVFLLF